MVIAGPTGVGKTRVSLETARHFGTEILSADSRQMYREMRIGTAVPSMEELALVRHHFIGNLSISDYYNASRYEEEAIALLNRLFRRSPVVVLTGGSMLYVDAVCNGIDDLPTIDPLIRDQLLRQYHREGIGSLRELVRQLDPEYYRTVDPDNPKRLLHALEICMMTGKPYSSFLKREKKQRSFRILKCGLNMDRKSLYEQINRRVDEMVAAGLEEEARGLLPFRSLNALNTVGYREWFSFFDGACTREETIAQIKSNTRRYARKQLTWFRRDQAITWFHPDETEKLITFIEKEIKPAK